MDFMDDGIDSDFENALAKELVEYGIDLLEHFPASEHDDILIDVLISGITALLLRVKITNPNFTHKQLLESVSAKLYSKFFARAGREDFTIDISCVN